MHILDIVFGFFLKNHLAKGVEQLKGKKHPKEHATQQKPLGCPIGSWDQRF